MNIIKDGHIDFDTMGKEYDLLYSNDAQSHLLQCESCLDKIVELVLGGAGEKKRVAELTKELAEEKMWGFTNEEFNDTDPATQMSGSALIREYDCIVAHDHSNGGVINVVVRNTYQMITEDGFSEIKPNQVTLIIPFEVSHDLINGMIDAYKCLDNKREGSDSND